MFKDITIGQYIAGKSVVHKLDARLKLILTFLFIIILFVVTKPSSYFFLTLATILVILMTKIPLGYYLKGLKPMLFIITFTVFINLFLTPGDIVWQLNILGLTAKITMQGIKMGLIILLRLTLLVCGTSILTLTTSPIMLTDAIEAVLSPLKVIKVPAHEIAMMMSIAIRFIPTIAEEADKIIKAQKARGADFESGNIIMRAKAMIPLLVPLFVGAFRRADELATAMDSRCYHGGANRTRMKQMKLCKTDYMAIIYCGVFIVLVAIIGYIL